MVTLFTVARREFAGYFATPVAAIFLIIFLALASAFTFFVGYFLERQNADLQAFFMFHPWLYLFMAPALSMRLWAEERRQGTIELFLTLPIPVWAAVLGKFFAAWLFLGLALAFAKGVEAFGGAVAIVSQAFVDELSQDGLVARCARTLIDNGCIRTQFKPIKSCKN